jgi:hypothetical protein
MSKAFPRFHRTNAPLPVLATVAYRVTVFYQLDNQVCLWNMDYIMASSVQTASSEQNLANNFITACTTAIRGCLAADGLFSQVKVQCLTNPARIPSIVAIIAGNQPGSVAGTHLPSEVAAIISKQTSTKGQHGRGRLYLPGVPNSFVTPGTDANRLNATGVAASAALATALNSATIQDGAVNASPAVTTRVLKGLPTTQGQTLTTFTSRFLLGTVRRRRIGRGK